MYIHIIFIFTYVNIYIYKCVNIYTLIDLHISNIYLCMNMYIYVYIYICTDLYIHIQICIYIYTVSLIHTYIRSSQWSHHRPCLVFHLCWTSTVTRVATPSSLIETRQCGQPLWWVRWGKWSIFQWWNIRLM